MDRRLLLLRELMCAWEEWMDGRVTLRLDGATLMLLCRCLWVTRAVDRLDHGRRWFVGMLYELQ